MRILIQLIVFVLCYSLPIWGGALDVALSAQSAILMNTDTGAVLYEKNAHTPAYPASTTKIATALYVLDHEVDLEKIAVVSKESLKGRPLKNRDELPPYWLDSDGTMMGLRAGEALQLDALLHGLMLISGNDAANVIAENIGGSVPRFMEGVNAYLKDLGCQNTQFLNPHGLTHPEHKSTAYDLALMTKRALEIPKFRKLVSTHTYIKPKTNKQKETEIKLINPLLKPNSKHYYPNAIGVKTGYTEAAKYNLVAAAEFEGRTLIAVVLGCEKKEGRFQDVKKLFEAAFKERKKIRRLLGPENLFRKEIQGLRAPLKAVLKAPLSITFFPSEEPRCKAALHWDIPSLPIEKGGKVGEIHALSEEGRLLAKEDLIAKEELKGSFFYLLKAKLLELFN